MSRRSSSGSEYFGGMDISDSMYYGSTYGYSSPRRTPSPTTSFSPTSFSGTYDIYTPCTPGTAGLIDTMVSHIPEGEKGLMTIGGRTVAVNSHSMVYSTTGTPLGALVYNPSSDLLVVSAMGGSSRRR